MHSRENIWGLIRHFRSTIPALIDYEAYKHVMQTLSKMNNIELGDFLKECEVDLYTVLENHVRMLIEEYPDPDVEISGGQLNIEDVL